MNIRTNKLVLLAMAFPLLLSVGCKSMNSDCGCGGSSSYPSGSSWTSWSPISWKHGDQVVSSCNSCESSPPVAKSGSGKVGESKATSERVNKIVVPDEKPRPLPSSAQ